MGQQRVSPKYQHSEQLRLYATNLEIPNLILKILWPKRSCGFESRPRHFLNRYLQVLATVVQLSRSFELLCNSCVIVSVKLMCFSPLDLSGRPLCNNGIFWLDAAGIGPLTSSRWMLMGQRLPSWLATQVVRSNRKNKSSPSELRQSLLA
ncbi:MAG: hypothetical protein DMF61_11340 [Blastocatellia bacterium AA13]|nr:MAG: hypothetical protein DMF61_11340 [Blastocatellia bacterium AA13]